MWLRGVFDVHDDPFAEGFHCLIKLIMPGLVQDIQQPIDLFRILAELAS